MTYRRGTFRWATLRKVLQHMTNVKIDKFLFTVTITGEVQVTSDM